MFVENVSQLENVAELARKALNNQEKRVFVCCGTGCVAAGSLKIFEKMKKLVAEKGLLIDVQLEKEEKGVGVKKSGCQGLCQLGPLVRIEPFDYQYFKVTEEDCAEIVEQTLINNEPIERLMYIENGQVCHTHHDISFFNKQTKSALAYCGNIDCESILEYIAKGGYKALAKALSSMTPEDVCNEVSKSGLRGRGGGGFPAGKKWQQVLAQKSEIKYIVCNGDEGDPGAFMDGSAMDGNPHSVVEGMIIAGFATKATEGYIYVRAEYPLSVTRLNLAVKHATEMGLLGENILGSGFNFTIKINRGAGAFVCGEGSALTQSIEGKRGMPRVKPPRTVEQGLWAKPTVLNNVETFANVPVVINKGADGYREIGTDNSPGTKAFALTGNIANTGLIEVPMGITLREVIYDIGGGIKDGKKFKAVQIGGPSGGCLTEKDLDLPLDFDSLKKVGAMIGSGGLVVMDEDTCMLDTAKFFMNFTKNESCGKCVPCREGTKRMLTILENIVSGKGKLEDIDKLLELADIISSTALCGLGKTAPSPVVSTITNFRDEYIAHIVHKKCPSKVCQNLKTIFIDKDACKGCSKCSKLCPVGAISGKIKEPFTIDKDKCIKCGSCIDSCAFKAIKEEW